MTRSGLHLYISPEICALGPQARTGRTASYRSFGGVTEKNCLEKTNAIEPVRSHRRNKCLNSLTHFTPTLVKDIRREELVGHDSCPMLELCVKTTQIRTDFGRKKKSDFQTHPTAGIPASVVNALESLLMLPRPLTRGSKTRYPRSQDQVTDKLCFLCNKLGHTPCECPNPNARKRAQSPRGSTSSQGSGSLAFLRQSGASRFSRYRFSGMWPKSPTRHGQANRTSRGWSPGAPARKRNQSRLFAIAFT